MKSFNKVFGIGLSKTGTTSLGKALTILGIKTFDFPRKAYLEEKEKGLPWFSTLKGYRGFTDFPCWLLYKELDALYPGSKFILTVRDPQKWYESRKRHYQARLAEGITMNWDMSERSVENLIKHAEEVRAYFKGRDEDLLVMNITEGEGWDKLCPFLGAKMPAIPFPHENRRAP